MRSQTIAFDTNACIYYLDGRHPFAELLALVVDRAASGAVRILLSAIVQAELLVRPYRIGDRLLIDQVLEFTEGHAGIVTSPITRDAVLAAAQIRAMMRLRLPDALIVGSAAVMGAAAVIGNDAVFSRLNERARIEVLTGARRHPVPRFIRLDDYV